MLDPEDDIGSSAATSTGSSKCSSLIKPKESMKISNYFKCGTAQQKQMNKGDWTVSRHSPKVETLKLLSAPPPKVSLNYVFPKSTAGRRMQAYWFRMLTWACLNSSGGMMRTACKHYSHMLPNKNLLSSRNQDAFTAVGHHGNRKAVHKLGCHDKSDSNKFCMETRKHKISQQQSIAAQISKEIIKNQKNNRKQLMIIARAALHSSSKTCLCKARPKKWAIFIS